ncbi:hypothetical protein HK100_009973 [Physocladia obscura]|uniref:RecA family profile 1 domain-containing protein n=1 Tax=Physocladia obscura TaxID=109957 RepID=A0AAD5T4K9_9FUNG|nr:hypothetical protein HK100_009973 [Physocladia obscura]
MKSQSALSMRTKQGHMLTTGCPHIDAELNGGLRTGQITEIYGESGSGKTQLGLQLGITCQWSVARGGLNASAAYILAEENFQSVRFLQLAESLSEQQSQQSPISPLATPATQTSATTAATTTTMRSLFEFTDNIHLTHVRDPATLIHIVQYMLPVLMTRHNIKLVVVDSVAATLRYASFAEDNLFDPNQKTTDNNNKSMHYSNSNLIVNLARVLKKIAADFNAVVVCINQVSAKFTSPNTLSLVPIASGSNGLAERAFAIDESAVSSGSSDAYFRTAQVQPALGLLWTCCVNTRICLAKESSLTSEIAGLANGIRYMVTRRRLRVVFSPNGPSSTDGLCLGIHAIKPGHSADRNSLLIVGAYRCRIEPAVDDFQYLSPFLQSATRYRSSLWDFLDSRRIRDGEWRAMPLSYQVALYGSILMAPDWPPVVGWGAKPMASNKMWYDRWRLPTEHASKVFALLRKQPWFDATVEKNRAFRWTARFGYLDIITDLLNDERVDPADDDNYAIQCAAEAGHIEIVLKLLSLPSAVGINPAGKNNYAMKRTAWNGHTEIFRILLNDPRTDPAVAMNEPIRNATINGHTAIVEMLLNDPRRDTIDPSSHNNYAITQAAARGHYKCVRILASDSRVDILDLNIFRNACVNGHAKIVEFLLGLPQFDPTAVPSELFLTAVSNGHVKVVEVMLENPRFTFPFNDLVFDDAVNRGHIEIVRLLLADSRFKPTKRLFILGNNTSILKLLLEDERIDPSADNNAAIQNKYSSNSKPLVEILLHDRRVRQACSLADLQKYQDFCQT